jgi:hypothetical protein
LSGEDRDAGPNPAGREGRDLSLDVVGIVRRNAAVLDEGVEGRVGGTTKSQANILLPELECVLARDAAVGLS